VGKYIKFSMLFSVEMHLFWRIIAGKSLLKCIWIMNEWV